MGPGHRRSRQNRPAVCTVPVTDCVNEVPLSLPCACTVGSRIPLRTLRRRGSRSTGERTGVLLRDYLVVVSGPQNFFLRILSLRTRRSRLGSESSRRQSLSSAYRRVFDTKETPPLRVRSSPRLSIYPRGPVESFHPINGAMTRLIRPPNRRGPASGWSVRLNLNRVVTAS